MFSLEKTLYEDGYPWAQWHAKVIDVPEFTKLAQFANDNPGSIRAVSSSRIGQERLALFAAEPLLHAGHAANEAFNHPRRFAAL